jgi:polyphosphate kinase 2 (PPK2 family)
MYLLVLDELVPQELLYADGRRSLLICLQRLDAGGKDGTLHHILGAMNPRR